MTKQPTDAERRARRAEAREALVRTTARLGYPAELGELLADELRSEVAMRRMIGYLLQAQPTSMEEIADELLAIKANQDRWIEQKISEHANASITAFYNRPRSDNEDA